MNEPISNKEVIDKLVDYFVKQNPKIVAKLLANYMVDTHRIFYHHLLPIEELEFLRQRCLKNSESLEKFIKYGPQGDLTCDTLSE